MDIIDNVDITLPENGEDIVIVGGRRYDYNGDLAKFKAFKVAKHIWVVPGRYYGEKLDIQDGEKINGGIYDKDFLSQNQEKQEFMDGVILLLKRINNTLEGKRLLSLITSAVPFPNEDDGIYKQNNFILSDKTFKAYTSNIIIFGPGANLVENKVIAFNSGDAENGLGTISEICFQPLLTYKFGDYFQDPALDLLKCLIKSLYYLYGIKVPEDFTLPYRLTNNPDKTEYSQVNMEDLLISGGDDLNAAGQRPYWLWNNYFIDAKDKFDKYKEIYENQMKLDPNLEINLSNHLEQKFNINISELWSLNISNFARTFNLKSPRSFYKALKYYYRKKYYKIHYNEIFGTNYNIYGFIDGQVNASLKETDLNIINKPQQIINLIDNNNILLIKSYIYDDELNKIDYNFYNNYEIPYNYGNSFKIPNITGILLPSVNYELIDKIPKIAEIKPYIKDSTPLPDSEKTPIPKELNVGIPLPIHYLDSQIYKGDEDKDFILSPDFLKVVSTKDKSLVYSFLPNIVSYFDGYDKTKISTDKKYYLWIREVLNNYSIDITRTENIIGIFGVDEIVPWMGRALNILNTENTFETELRKNGLKALLSKDLNVIFPKTKVDPIPTDNPPLTIEKIDEKLSDIYIKNKFFLIKNYYITIQQWWICCYSQFLNLSYMCREAIINQQNLIEKIILNQLSYLARETSINIETLYILSVTTEKTIEDLREISQKSMNNICNFFERASVSIFHTDIYNKFIDHMKYIVDDANTKIINYINSNSNITQEEKNYLINKYMLTEEDFNFFNFDKLINLFNSKIQLTIKNEKPEYNLLLSINQNESNENITDISGNNVKISYSNNINILDGRNEQAIYLDNDSQYVDFKSKNFENGVTNNFTISFWMRTLEKVDTNSTLLTSKLNENSAGWQLDLRRNGLVWSMKDHNKNEINIYLNDFLDISWHYIVVSVNRLTNILTVYIDGELSVNRNIEEIYNLYSDVGTIKLQASGSKVRIESFSILNRDIQRDEVSNRYINYIDNVNLRNIYGERLEYNKEYEVSNYVYPRNLLYKVNDIYLAIERGSNSSNRFKLILININEDKKFVQQKDIVIIKDVTQNKYLGISEDSNKIKLVDRNNALELILDNHLLNPNYTTFSTKQEEYLRLSNIDGIYNWVIKDVSRLNDIYSWTLI
ncbi:peptidase M27 (plasmid) [Paraclostridium bifermentans]|uniref:Non-toxic nonhemagglutinin n=1 Tax=Paraclostridium bifermentans TaxID=1490 RepID=NTNH_PARBF|nr:non-toxic nonhemagglutinin NTNH [Paraclostridium bifermentans]A0A5P3XKL4.1 RecName: Full=Non-toxic nonhemagglutinin; Short=NTNH [Paraclostridium bifermentans]QEZ70856.1 peptidase M27 [Paraclostridium bifermentans]